MSHSKLRTVLVALLTALFLSPIAAGQSQSARLADSAPSSPRFLRVDCHGDPLPEGAVARLGTSRLRHNCCINDFAFSPDGTTLVSVGAMLSGQYGRPEDHRIIFSEAKTGKEFGRAQYENEALYGVAYSPDGSTVVTGGNRLCWWDGKTRKLLRTAELAKADDGRVNRVASLRITPDGRTIVYLSADNFGKRAIHLADYESGKSIGMFASEQFFDFDQITVSPNSVMLAYPRGHSQIAICDIRHRKEIAQIEQVDDMTTMSFAIDGKSLFFDSERDKKVYLFDIANRKIIASWRSRPKTQHLSAIRESADGKKLLFVCDDQPAMEVDRAKDEPIRAFAMCGHLVQFTADGKIAASAGGTERRWGLWARAIHIWDLDAGKELSEFGGHGRDCSENLLIAPGPDGKTVATAGSRVCLWDARSGKELRSFDIGLGESAFDWSPDGKRMITASYKKIAVRDAKNGEIIRTIKTDNVNPRSVRLVANGKLLVGVSNQRMPVYVWDPDTGKEVHKWGPFAEGTHASLVSPDGNTLAMSDGGYSASLRDRAGKIKAAPKHLYLGGGFSNWSPDGKMFTFHFWSKESSRITIFNAETLERLGPHLQLTTRDDWPLKAEESVFSPDCRTLLVAVTGERLGPEHKRFEDTLVSGVQLFEAATGKMRFKFAVDFVKPMTCFSRDGRFVFTTSNDGTALVWEPMRMNVPDRETFLHGANDIPQHFWNILASDDACQAFNAMRVLAANRKDAIAIIGSCLHPAPELTKERFRKLLADLDSQTYRIRAQAAAELERFGDSADALLFGSLDKTQSAEVRQSVERIHSRIQQRRNGAERWREMRALEVLEYLDARELLQRLAEGASVATLTRDAKSALDRLENCRTPR